MEPCLGQSLIKEQAASHTANNLQSNQRMRTSVYGGLHDTGS